MLVPAEVFFSFVVGTSEKGEYQSEVLGLSKHTQSHVPSFSLLMEQVDINSSLSY